MVKHTFDIDNAILYVYPDTSLEKEDFVELAKIIDPYIEKNGDLSGLIIEAPDGFPGWENFSAVLQHFRFVRDHHKHIKKIGLVTDSAVGEIAQRLGTHFVSAEIRHFSKTELETAKRWIMADV